MKIWKVVHIQRSLFLDKRGDDGSGMGLHKLPCCLPFQQPSHGVVTMHSFKVAVTTQHLIRNILSDALLVICVGWF